MDQCCQDCVENMIKSFTCIFRQKSKDEVSVLLQKNILSAVASVGFGISQMLCSVQFNHHAEIRAIKVHLHSPPGIEENWKLDVQAKATSRFLQCFQPAIQESFTGAAGTSSSLRIEHRRTRRVNKQFARGVSTPSRISRRTLAA